MPTATSGGAIVCVTVAPGPTAKDVVIPMPSNAPPISRVGGNDYSKSGLVSVSIIDHAGGGPDAPSQTPLDIIADAPALGDAASSVSQVDESSIRVNNLGSGITPSQVIEMVYVMAPTS